MIDLTKYKFKNISGTGNKGEFVFDGKIYSDSDLNTCYIPDFPESTTEIMYIGGRTGDEKYILIDKFPDKLIYLEGEWIFSGDIILGGITKLPNTLKGLGWRCFKGSDTSFRNINISNLTIPSQITYINPECFYKANNIKTLKIPEGVKTISYESFAYCVNLESVILPSSLIMIESGAFRGCENLKTIEIPENNNLIGVGSHAFENTQWLKDRRENIQNNSIIDDQFIYQDSADTNLIFLYLGNVMLECHNNKRSTIPITAFKENTVGIGGKVFNDGENYINSDSTILEELTLPSSIRCISDYAFYGCTNLSTINLLNPNNIIYIGEEAFSNTAWWENKKNNSNIIYYDYIDGDKTYYYLLSIVSEDKEVYLEGNTKLIASRAIYNQNSIKKINIKEDGDSEDLLLGAFSISECESLESINFSNKKIKSYWNSISNCSNITIDELNFSKDCLFLGEISYLSGIDSSNSGDKKIEVTELIIDSALPNNAISLGWSLGELTVSEAEILENGVISGCSLSKCNIGSLLFSGKMESGVKGCGAFTNSKIGSIEINNSDFVAEEYSFSSMELGEITFPTETKNWTKIKEGTFYDCKGLTTIELPNSITYIDNYAFSKCSDLESISFSEKVYGFGDFCFSDCNKLTTIEIPEGVTILNKNLFENCSELVEITLPSTLKYIKQDVFKGCNKLTTINIPSIDLWFNIEFENKDSNPLNNGIATLKVSGNSVIDITIPKSLKKINDFLFYNYKNLTKFTIPENQGITYFGKESFYGCEKLSLINLLGNDIKEIKEKTFSGSGLTSIILPNTIERLDFMAFYNCKSLKNVTLENLSECNLNSFGISTFENCTSLEEIEIPEKLIKIPIKCFKNCENLRNLSNHENHKGFNIIESEAFYNCLGLNDSSSNLLFSNLSKIEDRTFYGCGFKELSFSKKLIRLGERCFENNSNLKTITFNSDSKIEIKKYSFKGCTNLITINNIDYCAELIENYSLNDTSWYSNKNDGLIYIGTGLYSYKGTMPSNYTLTVNNNTTYISPYAFKDQINLSKINTFPTSLKYLGKDCFNGCSFLTGDLKLNTLDTIGERAFKGCGKLSGTGIYIILAEYVNYEGSQLTEKTNINYIGNDAFRECRFYKENEDTTYIYFIYLPTTIQYLGHGVFQDITVGGQVKGISLYRYQTIIVNGNEVDKKSSLKQIGEKSFYKSLIVKNSFEDCSSLVSIENEAFLDCSCYSYTSTDKTIKMPGQIEYIGNDAFKNFHINADSNITFDFTNHNSIPRLGNSTVFEKSAEFIVPNSLYNKWINHSDWIYYKDNIRNQIDQDKNFVIDLGIEHIYSYSKNYNEIKSWNGYSYSGSYGDESNKIIFGETINGIFEKLLEYYHKAKLSSYYAETDNWIHKYQLNDFEKINLSYKYYNYSSEEWITESWNNIKYLFFRETTPAGSTTPPPSGRDPEIDRNWGITLSPPPPGFKCAKIFEDKNDNSIKIYIGG